MTLLIPDFNLLTMPASMACAILFLVRERSRRFPAYANALSNRTLCPFPALVFIDLTASHEILKPTRGVNEFVTGMILAVNGMLIDMLALVARKRLRRPPTSG